MTEGRFGRSLDGSVSRFLRSATLGGAAPAEAPETPAGLDEQAVLAGVDEFLRRGLDLLRWWEAAAPSGRFAERFDLGRTFNRPEESFGFFDRAPVTVGGEPRTMPVMGNYQEMFYDQPKSPRDGRADAVGWMRDQMRRFVLRYFMRVSDFRLPEGYAEARAPSRNGALDLLSWCPKEDVSRKGFGFQQLWYKRAGTGEIGRFPEEERFAIVDLGELGPVYEWIVVKVCIFDFDFSFRPFGSDRPKVVVPLQEDSLLVLTRDFVRDEVAPEPGVFGRFGIGYSFIKNPKPGFLAFGPGEFEAAIERIDFEIRDSGEVHVEMAFVANRPERIANLSLDPLAPMDWGLRMMEAMSLGMAAPFSRPARRLLADVPSPRFEVDPIFAYVDLANLLTGGGAAEDLCISREQLEKEFLVKHFMQHYQTVAGSLATWRAVGDWLDETSLPRWAVHGRSF
jgi:hypothetical protein